MPAQVTSDFVGKIGVVTGGSTGMGRATVLRLTRDGARVVFCSNDAASVDAMSNECGDEGLETAGLVADVAVAADMERVMAEAVSRYGGIDVLANCAGVQKYGTVVDTDEPTWDLVMAVNLKGCYLASRYAIPEMRKRGGGSIVHISSVQGQACQTRVAAYAASKGAVNALTRAMALDHAADRIRVNAVLPGSVDTPMLRASAELFKGERTAEELVREWGSYHPLGRALGRPCAAAEVAELIAFLLSDRASYISGAEFRADGALLAAAPVPLS